MFNAGVWIGNQELGPNPDDPYTLMPAFSANHAVTKVRTAPGIAI
jgi:hypothetical protein